MKPIFTHWAGVKKPHRDYYPKSWRKYHEPFLGPGATFFDIFQDNPSRIAYLSDLNPDLIECYQEIRDHPIKLIEELEKWENKKDFYNHIKNEFILEAPQFITKEQKAARFIYLNKTSMNCLYKFKIHSMPEFNKPVRVFDVPFGNRAKPNLHDKAAILGCSRMLSQATIECKSYLETFSDYRLADFAYFDPPYLKVDFDGYTSEKFGDKENRQLAIFLHLLDQRGVQWLLSQRDSEDINKLYELFEITNIGAGEVLIRNYK